MIHCARPEIPAQNPLAGNFTVSDDVYQTVFGGFNFRDVVLAEEGPYRALRDVEGTFAATTIPL